MPQIARLKITLDHIKPRVMRRLEVPLDTRLDELHLVIQAAMGWENCHLYEFRAADTSWSSHDPDGHDFSPDESLPASKATVADLLEVCRGRSFKYEYDFGDSWEHTIKVEAIAEAAQETIYPRLLAAENACPPEDVGGPWGYARYLEAIADPKHELHDELIEWGDPDFSPSAVDPAAIDERLALLAKCVPQRKKSARGRRSAKQT